MTQPKENFMTAVKHVVGFVAKDYLEVPHIADHRRDYFSDFDSVTGATKDILTVDDLWMIYDLDFKYQTFMSRKKAFRDFLSRCVISDDYIEGLLERAHKVEELTDFTDYINLRYASNVSALQKQTRGPKRPSSKSMYEISLKTKIKDFIPVSCWNDASTSYAESGLLSDSLLAHTNLAPITVIRINATSQTIRPRRLRCSRKNTLVMFFPQPTEFYEVRHLDGK